MAAHPNSLVNTMALLGYGLEDMLPAHPGQDVAYVDQVLRDNALALSRPVIPYGLLGIHESRTRYFNMSRHGFRSIGEEQAWPPSPDAINVFFFGGSTTLGFNVEDRHAVPHFLRQRLKAADSRIETYNFGCGNYASRHEALRFLDLLDRGITPHLAVFLDGYNDSFYALGNRTLVGALDQLYQSEKRRRRLGWLSAVLDYADESRAERGRPLPTAATQGIETEDKDVLALVSAESIGAALAGDGPDILPAGQQRLAETVWSGWLDSNEMIRGLARRHKVRTLFAWQPVPLFATPAGTRIMERLFPVFPNSAFCSVVYKWLEKEGFPGLADGIGFLDLSRAGENRDTVSYVDLCHYNAAFAEDIAARMLPAVIDLLPLR